MAGQASNRQETFSNTSGADQANELSMELDDGLVDSAELVADQVDDETDNAKSTGKVIFAKSTDIRRKLEEKLEVQLLKDQLGMDDLGF
jgi:hypothetical protein